MKKFEEDCLTPAAGQPKEAIVKDLDQFCAKTTALIECLLPKIVVDQATEVAE